MLTIPRFFAVRLLLLPLLLLSPFAGKAQTLDEIRNSGRYYFGTGEGNNYNATRRDAKAPVLRAASYRRNSIC